MAQHGFRFATDVNMHQSTMAIHYGLEVHDGVTVHDGDLVVLAGDGTVTLAASGAGIAGICRLPGDAVVGDIDHPVTCGVQWFRAGDILQVPGNVAVPVTSVQPGDVRDLNAGADGLDPDANHDFTVIATHERWNLILVNVTDRQIE